MSGKEIRNFEFKRNAARAYINEKGELKFEKIEKKGKGKKDLEKLKPIFEAIIKQEGDKKKLDTDKEIGLMNKLHQLLMADGVVDNNEIKLGDEFKKSGMSVEAFIDKKLAEANQQSTVKQPVVEQPVVQQQTVVEEQPVVEQQLVVEEQSVVEEEPVVQQTPTRPDPRVSANAYNQTIQNERARLESKREELEPQFVNVQTVKYGDSLYKIAVNALKAEGVEKPNAKEINTRIAEIAMLNNIDNVNAIKVGTPLKVGKVAQPDAGATGSTPPADGTTPPPADGTTPPPADGTTPPEVATPDFNVAPSSIEITNEKPEKALEEAGYSAETKNVEAAEGQEAFEYKEWTKENSAPMFTTEVDGVQLAATSLDELKANRAAYKEAQTITEAPANEADDAKAARQAKNLENLKNQVKLSGDNIEVIKSVIEQLKTDGIVDLKSADTQAFVQELIKTKNVEVLTAMLIEVETDAEGEETKTLNLALLGENKESAETLASLYKEIRAKENAGIRLTDEEIALKDFMKESVTSAESLYTIPADAEAGTVEKQMKVAEILGEVYYTANVDGTTIKASSPELLDEIVKDLKEAGTDETKLAAVFNKYVNTEDKILAGWLAENADTLKAKKEDVETLIANNGVKVVTSLNYTPVAVINDVATELEGYTSEDKTEGTGENEFSYKAWTKEGTALVYTAEVNGKTVRANTVEDLKAAVAEYKEFNNAVGNRVVECYTNEASKGDPANMRYLEEAFARIDVMDKTAEEKQALKDQIVESYFDTVETITADEFNTSTLTDYTAADKTDGEFAYKEWTKEGEATVYTTEINGKTYKADSLEDLKAAVTPTKEYAFKPSRRPTVEEMQAFFKHTNGAQNAAIIKTITLDDMGPRQWASVLEDVDNSGEIVARYSEIVAEMESEAEVLDFIQNKIVNNKCLIIPFNKILEKYPDNEEINVELLKQLASFSSCSDVNRVALIKTVLNEDGTAVDTAKLPEGMSVTNLVDNLPWKCDGENAVEDAKEVFDAVLAGLGKDNLDEIDKMADKVTDTTTVKNKLTSIINDCTDADVDYLVGLADKFKDKCPVDDEVKAKLGELVNADAKNKALVQQIAKVRDGLCPYGTLREIDAQEAEWDDATKAIVFVTLIDRFDVVDKEKFLAKAVDKHLAVKVANNKYAIGDNIYLTDWRIDNNNNGKADAGDTIKLKTISKTGYERGQDMFNQLDETGSGKIHDMIVGTGDYANYMTTDNIAGIIKGFNDSSEMGLMEFLQDEWTDYSAGFCSRVPKMLMRKAQEMGSAVTDTQAYKNLATYYGAQGNSVCANGVPAEGDAFTFTQNVGDKELTKDQAKELDKLINALANVIIQNSSV